MTVTEELRDCQASRLIKYLYPLLFLSLIAMIIPVILEIVKGNVSISNSIFVAVLALGLVLSTGFYGYIYCWLPKQQPSPPVNHSVSALAPRIEAVSRGEISESFERTNPMRSS